MLCGRARQMHQRARSGPSHGCKWDQHGNLNHKSCLRLNRSARGVPSARWPQQHEPRRRARVKSRSSAPPTLACRARASLDATLPNRRTVGAPQRYEPRRGARAYVGAARRPGCSSTSQSWSWAPRRQTSDAPQQHEPRRRARVEVSRAPPIPSRVERGQESGRHVA